MARLIEFELNASSVSRAIKELEAFKKAFLEMCNNALKALGEIGVSQQKFHIIAFAAVKTGELSRSAGAYFNEQTRTAFIYNSAYYAVFVEYGTGIVGSASPYYGDSMPSSVTVDGKTYSQYDTNGHGALGWYYIGGRDGKLHWTMGQPSRPFFYLMKQDIKRIAPEIYRRMCSEL